MIANLPINDLNQSQNISQNIFGNKEKKRKEKKKKRKRSLTYRSQSKNRIIKFIYFWVIL